MAATRTSDSSSPPPLRVALLGSGIFASSAHAPLLRSDPRYECVAVWSRRIDRAEALSSTFSGCQSYGGPDGLDDLLNSRKGDVDAVVMALPLDVQPTYVLRCLEAGLHVLSEKPIAPTVQVARELVETNAAKYRPRNIHWSVGENYRYEPALLAAAEVLRRNEIGRPILFSVTSHLPFAAGNKYLKTEWRSRPAFHGGLFVDAFVHSVAAIRLLMEGGAGLRARTASAIFTDTAEHIPGPDTMAALAAFGSVDGEDGSGSSEGALTQGIISATFAGSDRRYEISVTGSDGRLDVRRNWDATPGYELLVYPCDGGEPSKAQYPFGGIEAEMEAFAEACRAMDKLEDAKAMDRNTPEEALADLVLMEALLDSGEAGGILQSITAIR